MGERPARTSGPLFGERVVEVDGVDVGCLVAGPTRPTGTPPLVLLPGASVDSARLSYRRVLGGLSRGRRVLAPDWPGQGASGDLPSGALEGLDVGFYAGFVGRFMDACGVRRADLAGLSLGGAAALGFVLRRPGRVGALVLANPYGLGGGIPRRRLVYLAARALARGWCGGGSRTCWARRGR